MEQNESDPVRIVVQYVHETGGDGHYSIIGYKSTGEALVPAVVHSADELLQRISSAGIELDGLALPPERPSQTRILFAGHVQLNTRQRALLGLRYTKENK
jgi:hypothetical protein